MRGSGRSAGLAVSRLARLVVPARRQTVVIGFNRDEAFKAKPIPQVGGVGAIRKLRQCRLQR